MPVFLALPSSRIASVVTVLAAAVLLSTMIVRAWKKSRPSLAELERRRRYILNAQGKMGDATLVEMRDDLIFYSYDVRGIEYTASQDVSALHDLLPDQPMEVNGVVYIKYDPRNPANSIVLAEGWNGLRNLATAVEPRGKARRIEA